MTERLFLANNIALLMATFIIGMMQIAILHSFGFVLRRSRSDFSVLITDEGPAIHEVFPPFTAVDENGALIDNQTFVMKETIVLFLSENCLPCQKVLEGLRKLPERYGDPFSIILVVGTLTVENRKLLSAFPYEMRIVPDITEGFKSQLGVTLTPHGFLIDKAGIVRMKGVINHFNHLEALLLRRGKAIPQMNWEILKSD